MKTSSIGANHFLNYSVLNFPSFTHSHLDKTFRPPPPLSPPVPPLYFFFPSSFRLLKIYLLFFSLLISLFLTCLFTFTFSSSLPRVLFLFPFDSRVIFLTPGFAFSTHVETPGRGDGGAPAARLRRRFAALLALYSTFFTLLSPLPVGSFFLPLPSLQKFDVR